MKTIISKKNIVVLFFLFVGIGIQSTQAQFWKKLEKRVSEEVEEAVIRKTAEKSVEKAENSVDSVFEAPSKARKKKKRKPKRDTNSSENEEIVYDENESTKNEDVVYEENQPEESIEAETVEDTKPWSNYNFVPGDKVIFQDDLSNEENGEFPSRWDLISGSAENAVFNQESIINLENHSLITPLMDKKDYLPEVFTIEFDAYFFSKEEFYSGWQNYEIRFDPKGNGVYYPEGTKDYFEPIKLYRSGAKLSGKINGIKKEFNGSEKELDVQAVWRHFAIAFNKRSLKVFVDQHRVLNIPNLGENFKPQQFYIKTTSKYKHGSVIAIKNIRVAEGGKKLYDRVLSKGRFVARGILFDVNKATLKPESMGVINRVAKMMEQHTDFNFRIEGHTDSDGDNASNLELSAQRALAVKKALVAIGIDQSRLKTEGKGESVPISDNTSPEGKANNRRVEFIKL